MDHVNGRRRPGLSKPWLFGLYGALGGLVGAVVLGEALWGLLRPSAPGSVQVPPLRLAVSPSLDLYQAGSNHFSVKIARDGWSGPVTLKAVGPPAGIVVEPATLAEDRSEAKVEVKALDGAPIGTSELTLEAGAPPHDNLPTARASIRLGVRKPLSSRPALRLSVSPAVVVDQGGKNRFGVVIARDHFAGPVRLESGALPDGVTATTLTLPDGVSTGEIEVQAGADATLGSLAMTVTASVPEIEQGKELPPPAFSRLNLTVNPRLASPPELRLGTSPGVVLDQSSKNRFGVIIARDRFDGPVTVAMDGLPDGVTATTLTLPAGATHGEIEVQAAANATVGTQAVGVTATGPAGLPGTAAPPKAFSRLNLTVHPYKASTSKVDIMFVLDVTGSMGFAIDGIRDGIIEFAGELEKHKLDVRVGLAAFRDHLVMLPEEKKAAPRPTRRKRTASPPATMPGFAGMRPLDQAPRLLIIGDEVFTKNYRSFGTKVGENLVAAGGNDQPESSFDALALASRQPFREDANRALILITDADPHIPDLEVKSTKQMVGLLHEGGINQLHLVIRNEFRAIYAPLQEEAPGSVFDLEEAARKKGAFAELLPVVSREIARITIASQPPPPPSGESQAPPPAAAAAAPLDPPESSKPPPVPPAPAARDLPEAAPPPMLRGVQSRETFAAESSGRLLVAIAAWTAAIAAMIALALCAGQHHYLRRGWLPAARALWGWLGGLLAGLAGGAAGQLLFQTAPGAPAGEAIFRILGWTLLGSMAGFVLAFFVPNLRSYRGMLGGAAGGAAGALAFLAASLALRDQPGGDAIGRVLGAVLLGLAIGLMLALAERIARKAWLEIHYPGGETRTVNLGIEPVSIGSNSRAATIYARGTAPVAYRYWFRDGMVKQQDVLSGLVGDARPGEAQSIGAVTVTIRTAASASAKATTTAPRTAPSRGPAIVAPAPPPPAAPVAATAPILQPSSAAPVATLSPGPAAPASIPTRPVATSRPAPAQGTANCPGCGRPIPGLPGQRYCITCDLYS